MYYKEMINDFAPKRRFSEDELLVLFQIFKKNLWPQYVATLPQNMAEKIRNAETEGQIDLAALANKIKNLHPSQAVGLLDNLLCMANRGEGEWIKDTGAEEVVK